MKRSGVFFSIMILLGVWQLAAMGIQNDFLMPYPMDVFSLMAVQCRESSFYEIVIHTLFRSLLGLSLALCCAALGAFLSYFYTFVKYLLSPFILLTKSIPNVSYIIIILVWFGSQSSSVIIPFLILFPVIYANLYNALLHMDQDVKDVIRLYPETPWRMLQKVYIPLLLPAINASLSSGLGLALKVGVMAEIIGQVQLGIGRQLNIARFNMDMTAIFAWTLWIILLLLILEWIRKYSMDKLKK